MKIKVGKVLKAQGIKGEVKAACLLDDSQMLKHVKKMYVNNSPFTVAQLRCDGNFFFVRFAEITDRNAAENLRDWELFCNKEDLHLDAERYFIDDVVGCRVVLDNGKTVGEVVEVLQYGAADVLVCKNGEKEISFPFLKDLAVLVNVQAKSIVLSAKRFVEVALYED
ncbi:MAG: ribosome maturation factor RimM [Candidatus Fimimonas sp.]